MLIDTFRHFCAMFSVTSLKSTNHLSSHSLSIMAAFSSMDSKVIRCISPPIGFIVKFKTPSARMLSSNSTEDCEECDMAITLLSNSSLLSKLLVPLTTRVTSSSMVYSIKVFLASSVASPSSLELMIRSSDGFL